MGRKRSKTRALAGGFAAWIGRYVAWVTTTMLMTLSGATLLMLAKDWTIKALFTSVMVWPMLALGALLAIPVALLPLGRPFLYTAASWALLYNLILIIS